MRPLFEARLVNEDFGDPGLYVDLHGQRRALLFDLGDLSAVPPRKMLRLSDIFVTHTHVDHFIGFDQLLRVILGRKARLSLIGGPAFVDQIDHRLRSYSWNVVHRYEVELVLDVTAIGPGARRERALFSSRRNFERMPADAPQAAQGADGDVVLAEPSFRVRARFVDHDIPCLAYAIEEERHVNVWKNRLADLGLPTGPWLQAAKRAILEGAGDDTEINAQWRDRQGEHRIRRPLGELRSAFAVVAGQRIGYVTDLRYTDANLSALDALLNGVDILFIESVFLEADRQQAERKNHLTAWQAGSIGRRLGARAVIPFHFSPRYEERAGQLRAEVHAAWAGEAPPPG